MDFKGSLPLSGGDLWWAFRLQKPPVFSVQTFPRLISGCGNLWLRPLSGPSIAFSRGRCSIVHATMLRSGVKERHERLRPGESAEVADLNVMAVNVPMPLNARSAFTFVSYRCSPATASSRSAIGFRVQPIGLDPIVRLLR